MNIINNEKDTKEYLKNYTTTKSKTIKIEVNHNYDCGFAFEIYKEDLLSCARDLDIIVKNKNSRNFANILKDWDQVVSMDYKYKKTIGCTGYSQSDWDTYTIYYKEWNEQTQLLADLLERLFTHKNDYSVNVMEYLSTGHSKMIHCFVLSITDIEFPEHEDIKEEIDECLYDEGIKYDEIVYNLNY